MNELLQKISHRVWKPLYPDPLLPDMNYDLYWKVRQARPLPPRVYAITELLEPNTSVLDIGCGDGELYSYVTKKLENIDWYGLDVSQIALDKAAAKGMQCAQADITNEGFTLDRSYDYIVVTEVLEHIINPEKVLLKIKPYFNKALILTVPNIAYYKHRWRMCLGRFPIQWQWHPSEHIRYWSLKDFAAMLTYLGFEKYRLITTNGFPYENKNQPKWHRFSPNLLAEGAIFYVGN